MDYHWRAFGRSAAIALIDIALVSMAFYGAYLIRFDFDIWPEYRVQIIKLLPLMVIVRIAALYDAGGYRGLWKYTSVDDMMRLLKGVLVGTAFLIGVNYFRNEPLSMVAALLFLAFVVMRRNLEALKGAKRMLLVSSVALSMVVVSGFLAFAVLMSAPVSVADFPVVESLLAWNFQQALAMPRAVLVLESILCFLLVCGVRVGARLFWEARVSNRKPFDGRTALQPLGNMDVEKLLERPEVHLDPERVVAYLRNRVVLVTGAGGSIGSELCRQVGQCDPRRLVLMGNGEHSIHAIEKELADLYPAMEISCVIGDVRDAQRVAHVFHTCQPEVVFHAAAHKHVALMEENPEEAVLTNVFGTRTLAQAAIRFGVSRFVMMSTDKAVALNSVMGASKRLAEMVLQRLSHNEATTCVTVRFGNVLGSRGSVVPLFERQIRAGGPVTVTHPDLTRYFMSIPEAVRLVLHSGAVGHNGDVCILDLGKPVRFLELAENLIRLAGKKPYEDIEIIFTGMQPGEALEEPLLYPEEARCSRKIDQMIVSHPVIDTPPDFEDRLERLRQVAVACRRDDVVRMIGELLPEYERQR